MRTLILLLVLSLTGVPATAEPLRVFAAASLADVLRDMSAARSAAGEPPLTIVAAGSSILARQIVQGAPADLYLSANADWMTWAEAQGALDPDTRRNIAANRLVLIRTHGAKDVTLADLAGALGDGRLATALTEAVPAGVYARQTLTAMGLWDDLHARLAQTDNVRAALMLVALGEAPYGLVYATDARAETRVEVTEVIPEVHHDPIVYPGAVTRAAAQPVAALALLDWMAGPEAQAILTRHGFAAPPG